MTALAVATTAQRRWNLAAAIASVSLFGLSIGQGVPLLSLLLDARGTPTSLNGLNAAAAFVGVLIGPLLAQHGVRRLGVRNFLLLSLLLDIISFPLLKLFHSIDAWFVLRMISGVVGSGIFTTSEAWINLLAGDAGRGRVVGLYATALSAGFGLGPLLLSLTGIDGWAPFIANISITALAALPLLGVGNLTRDFGRAASAHPFTMFARAPLVLLAVALFGLYEATLMALLPVWGVRRGLNPEVAAVLLSAVFAGAVVLQWPIGWLSDHVHRRIVLRICGVVGLLGATLLILPLAAVSVLLAAIALWGGCAAAIYPVALSMAGDRFRGDELVSVNAAIIIAYGLGGLVGPGLGGMAMQLWDPQGLGVFIMALFAIFLLASLLRDARA